MGGWQCGAKVGLPGAASLIESCQLHHGATGLDPTSCTIWSGPSPQQLAGLDAVFTVSHHAKLFSHRLTAGFLKSNQCLLHNFPFVCHWADQQEEKLPMRFSIKLGKFRGGYLASLADHQFSRLLAWLCAAARQVSCLGRNHLVASASTWATSVG